MHGECSLVGEHKCWDGGLIICDVINSAILYSQAAIGYGVAIVLILDVERFSISGLSTFDAPYPYNVCTSFALGIAGGVTVGGAVSISKGLMKITGCALGIAGFEHDNKPMLNHEKDILLPQLSHVDLLNFWVKHTALHFGAVGYGAFGGMFVAKRMTEIEFSYVPVVNGIITSAMGVGMAVAGAGVGAILGGAVGGVVGVLHVAGCSIGIVGCKLKSCWHHHSTSMQCSA